MQNTEGILLPHVEPKRLFELAQRNSAPTENEARHMRNCSRCLERHFDFIRQVKSMMFLKARRLRIMSAVRGIIAVVLPKVDRVSAEGRWSSEFPYSEMTRS
jgi:hypothetical protein